jgi:hypothetical protein
MLIAQQINRWTGVRMTNARETDVRRIRQLGTIWDKRGPRYWLRRSGLSFVLGMAAVFFVAAYGGVLTGLWQVTHGAVVHTALAIVVLAAGAVFLIGWPIVMFLMSFRRYYSAEEALAVLERRRRAR